MQFVTPGGNHCCLMANDVHNWRLVHSFINIKHRDRQTYRERQRDRLRQTDIETERQRDRQKETETHREKVPKEMSHELQLDYGY